MNSALRLLLLVAALAAAARIARRRDGPGRPLPVLWDFWTSLRLSFAGWNALGVAAAVVVTALLVWTGADRHLQDAAQRESPFGRAFLRAVLEYGGWWTATVAAVLLLVGWLRQSGRWRLAGAAAAQAVLAALVVTLALKLWTGRLGPASPDGGPPPPFPKGEDAADFAFDFWHRVSGDGRFFWPSGHTSSSMTLVAALATCFPRARWIPWVGYPLVAFMGIAMVDGDFHWTSDVLAAVFLGYPLGRTIGSRLAAEYARRA